MEDLATVLIYSLIVFAVSLAGAALPLMIKMNDKQLHLMISLSAGVFIGVLFLMLMPEALEETEHGGFEMIDGMYALLIGFVIVLIIDFILKNYMKSECDCETCQDLHSHDITSLSAFIGLAIHACFDGLMLAAAFYGDEEFTVAMLIALCIHKAVVVFSLSSTFILSNRKNKALKYLIVFCLISPIAAIVSFLFLDGMEPSFTGLALMFSAGIFMFVTMCDILPEAFHRKNMNMKSIIMLVIGLAIIVIVAILTGMMGGHGH